RPPARTPPFPYTTLFRSREAQVAHGDVPARRRDHYGLELDLLRMHRAALQLLDLGQHGGLELLALAGRGGEPLLGALHVADVLGALRGPAHGGRWRAPPAAARAQNGARDAHGPGLELPPPTAPAWRCCGPRATACSARRTRLPAAAGLAR